MIIDLDVPPPRLPYWARHAIAGFDTDEHGDAGLFVVYRSTASDRREFFSALIGVEGGGMRVQELRACSTLECARSHVPQDMPTRIPAMSSDDPRLVEVWV